MNTAEIKEIQAWENLCSFLLYHNLVTPQDLRSPRSSRKTKGQELFSLIQEWGMTMRESAVANSLHKYFPALKSACEELLKIASMVDSDHDVGEDPLKKYKDLLDQMRSVL